MNSNNIKNILDTRIEMLKNIFSGYSVDDIFATTSLDKESTLLIYLLQEAKINCELVFINSGLIKGEIQKNIEIFDDTFDINLKVIDVSSNLKELLGGHEFDELDEKTKKEICNKQKKEVLNSYLQKNNKSIWISGIRSSQTEERQRMKALSISNGLIKYSPIFNLTSQEIYFIMKSINLRQFYVLTDLCKQNDSRECGLHV